MARLADLEQRIAAAEAKIEAYKVRSADDRVVITDAIAQGGRVIVLNIPIADNSTQAKNNPFALLDATDDDGNKIRVVYGLVGGIQPDGMSEGDNPIYVLDVSGDTGYVYLIVSVDSGYSITDVSIDTGATVPDDEDFVFYYPIGSFSISDSVLSIAQGISGSQDFKWCGTPLFALS